MTKNEFIELCNEYLILPSLALENLEIRDALLNMDDELIKELLSELF